MTDAGHIDSTPAGPPHPAGAAITRQAVSATLHCLTGCAIGEVLGLVIATALGWSVLPSIALAIGLAFVFGYSLTIGPVLRAGVGLRAASGWHWRRTPCRSP